MKILVFTTLYPNGIQNNHGIFVERRVLEFLNRYSAQARIVAPVPMYPGWFAKMRQLPNYENIPEKETRNGIEVWHPRYPVIPGITWRVAPLLIYWFSRKIVERLHDAENFDLLDAHFAFPDGVAGSMLAKTLHIPCVVTARGSDINESPKHWLPKKLLQSMFGSTDHLICVSQRLKERMLELGAISSKVSVLPNGIDTSVFKPTVSSTIPSKFGVKEPFILSVGSLRNLKGHHLIIEALASNTELREVSLLIAGTGTMQNELKALIEDLGLGKRVRLIGEIPNESLPALYTAADLFVLASSNEGCPNVVLEALACNTRVVSTDVGAVPDLLPAELYPFLVRERNTEEIGRQIRKCLHASFKTNLFRERAIVLNWEKTCESLNAIFCGVVKV